jgi:YbbR domain-containing protein
MDSNAEQLENGLHSIRVSFESESNVRDEREEHEEKQPLQRASTDDGIEMDFNASQFENALLSIRLSFELNSNVMDEMDRHL